MEADMQAHYGLDLREMLWGENPMGVRRILSLIKHLPPTCALARAADPDAGGKGWTVHDELLATLIEVVDLGNRNFVAANSKPHSKQPKPIRVPRPYEAKKAERKIASTEEAKAFFSRGGRR